MVNDIEILQYPVPSAGSCETEELSSSPATELTGDPGQVACLIELPLTQTEWPLQKSI